LTLAVVNFTPGVQLPNTYSLILKILIKQKFSIPIRLNASFTIPTKALLFVNTIISGH
jgi:hypothetical protein